jgi:HEAT repeat protein
MSEPHADLVERLSDPDFNERAKALAALVRAGRPASPALAGALDSEDDAVRAQAARGLAEIADAATADRLAAATHDRDPVVRASAALGLARINDDRAVEALVRTLDDFPDFEHDPYTSSVYALIDLGRPALPAVAPLLSAEDPTTRVQAWAVVTGVLQDEADAWVPLWESLGRYDPSADEEQREAAATRWQAWIRDHARD